MIENSMVPSRYFFTKGVGRHEDELVAFEFALRDARIQQFNLIPVTSIKPPKCKEISIDEGLKGLADGQVILCVFCKEESCRLGDLVGASVAVAVPGDPERYGYFAEYNAKNVDTKTLDILVQKRAMIMLATKLGLKINLDFNQDLDVLKKNAMQENIISRIYSHTITAKVERDGEWTCVISTVVLLS
ncbi:MAG: pyruvoyl-dependent arginine decarboxylase [Promethearchaeota archaeon]